MDHQDWDDFKGVSHDHLTFHSKLDPVAETLQIETRRMEKVIVREVFSFKDRKVREALIQLGWTPPPAIPDYHVAQEPIQFQSMALCPAGSEQGGSSPEREEHA